MEGMAGMLSHAITTVTLCKAAQLLPLGPPSLDATSLRIPHHSLQRLPRQLQELLTTSHLSFPFYPFPPSPVHSLPSLASMEREKYLLL